MHGCAFLFVLFSIAALAVVLLLIIILVVWVFLLFVVLHDDASFLETSVDRGM